MTATQLATAWARRLVSAGVRWVVGLYLRCFEQ